MKTINVRINNNEFSSELDIKDNIYYFNIDNSTCLFDNNKNIFRKENDNLKIKYIFNIDNIEEGYILEKETNNKLFVDIETTKLEKEDNIISIEYKIGDDLFKFNMEVL